jgi:hypothetical protein
MRARPARRSSALARCMAPGLRQIRLSDLVLLYNATSWQCRWLTGYMPHPWAGGIVEGPCGPAFPTPLQSASDQPSVIPSTGCPPVPQQGGRGELMSDNVLSVIPGNPRWQPNKTAADRTVALVKQLVPLSPSGLDVEMDVDWYDTISVVPCHQNLSRISCPSCGASIDTEWWADLLEERNDIGFDDLLVAVPCCRARTSLDALQYDWPCGFARFEIAIWNPDRDWFTDEEMASLADALGHPVNQIMAHI